MNPIAVHAMSCETPCRVDLASDLDGIPGLPADRADVWLLTVDNLLPHRSALARTLCSDEQARRDRFARDELKLRFELFHGAVRLVLARYLSIPPADLVFGASDEGKPHIASPRGGLHFNLSHTGDTMVLVCSRAGPVGIDIESASSRTDITGIASRFFHPNEQRVLAACDDDGRQSRFFRWWTAKEAYLKARGTGIANGLAGVDCSAWSDQSAVDLVPSDDAPWRAVALPLDGVLHGTVVVRPGVRTTTMRRGNLPGEQQPSRDPSC